MRSARFGCRARGSRRRVRGGDFALHEAFHRGDRGQFALVDDVAAIGIEKAVAVGAGVQIEPEGPRAPEHVDVPVGEARVVKVDETREAPVVQDDVWQAVVAVEKRVRTQFAGGLGGDAVGVCGGGPRAELRVEAAGAPAALDVAEIPRAHVGHVERGEAIGLRVEQLVQRAQADGEEVAEPLRLGEVAGGSAVVAGDRARDEPVGVRAAAGQIFHDFGAEAELVERGAHARFVGERAGGRGLREQGVGIAGAVCGGAEGVDARFRRAAGVMDCAASCQTSYGRWRVGDGGNRCVVHGWAALVCGDSAVAAANRLSVVCARDWTRSLLILVLGLVFAGLHGWGEPERQEEEQRRRDHYAEHTAPAQQFRCPEGEPCPQRVGGCEEQRSRDEARPLPM